jgi:hypothetical protein
VSLLARKSAEKPKSPDKDKEKKENAEDYFFDALCRLQDMYQISSIEEIQNLIQASYRFEAIPIFRNSSYRSGCLQNSKKSKRTETTNVTRVVIFTNFTIHNFNSVRKNKRQNN